MTGIVVTYNTREIARRAIESIRKFHPALPLIIVDGSSSNDPCYGYVRSLREQNTTVYQPGYNIGHGKGMHYALEHCRSETALVFDSDIVMTRSPVCNMLAMMDEKIYGVGWIYHVGEDGFDYGDPTRIHKKKIPYLHPYFMLLNVKMYFQFHPFVHHGAPCYKAMVDIYEKGLSEKILKSCPGLTGHTSGEGINWKGTPSEYIQHEFGGTRKNNKSSGRKEIVGKWER